MTHPILTKAARAVGDCIRQERPLGVPATNADIARAVLQAIQEPDEGMIEAMHDLLTERGCNPLSDDAEAVWQTAIDHLLNTKD